jgi:putative protease
MIKKATSVGGNKDGFNKPELLAPAGSYEKMVTAIHYGADAIYCGGKQYSLRAHATNFSDSELKHVVDYSHQHGVKVYVTVNIFAHQRDFAGLADYLLHLRDIDVDGIIVSDPGVVAEARRLVPDLELHLSTQANITNGASALFWRGQGVSRINLARELTLSEIRGIKQELNKAVADMELEVFVHGALCISYSGRCLLSSYLTGRNANRGECAHPCRYSYTLLEEKRPGQYFPVEEDDRGTYIFNSKDLCLLPALPELVRTGVDSLKIEGRMKSLFYVGGVVRVYRAAIDYLWSREESRSSGSFPAGLEATLMEELAKVGTRGGSDNFISGPPNGDAMLYHTPRLAQEYIPAGVVRNIIPAAEPGQKSLVEIEFRNPVNTGEELEFLGPGLESFFFTVQGLQSPDNVTVDRANPGDCLQVVTASPANDWQVNGLIRKKIKK